MFHSAKDDWTFDSFENRNPIAKNSKREMTKESENAVEEKTSLVRFWWKSFWNWVKFALDLDIGTKGTGIYFYFPYFSQA